MKKQFSIKIEKDCIERIRAAAKKRDRSMNYIVRETLLKTFPEKKRGAKS